jgi:hypothetical protein
MKIKETVRFKEINKYSLKFFNAVLMMENRLHFGITITSGNDGEHMDDSFHYEDKAWDIRTKDKTAEEVEQMRLEFVARLGYGWDVVVEKTHIHVERDTRTYPE